MLKDIEMNHLRLAYETGQRDKQTFEEWYEATFDKWKSTNLTYLVG